MYEIWIRSNVEKCGKRGDNDLMPIRCVNPQHEDRNPSGFANAATGFFGCASCGFEAWSDQVAEMLGWDDPAKKWQPSEEYRSISRKVGRPQQSAKPKEKPPKGEVQGACERLKADKEVTAYLKGRGITGATAKRFRLGSETRGGKRLLVIPHVLDGRPVNRKYRDIEADKKGRYSQDSGAEQILFNCDSLPGSDFAVICEGELDAISVSQVCGEGFPVVSPPCGGGQSFRPEWVDRLRGCETVYLALDQDDAGRKFARKLAVQLGEDRCRLVRLQGAKDANEWLQAHELATRSSFDSLLKNAKPVGLDRVYSPQEILSRDAAWPSLQRDPDLTPWPSLNNLLTNWPRGSIASVMAYPKIGKTSLCSQWLKYRVDVHSETVLHLNLDMGPQEVVSMMVEQQAGMSAQELGAGFQAEGLRYFESVDGRWWICTSRLRSLDGYLDLVRRAHRFFGFDWLMVDHFHEFCSSMTNSVQEQANTIRRLRDLARELDTRLLLVVQPRKESKSKFGGEGWICRSADILGSGQIKACSHHMITLSRSPMRIESGDYAGPELLERETLVLLEFSRSCRTGRVYLDFDGPSKTFREQQKL